MTMTRRDFVAISAAIHREMSGAESVEARVAIRHVAWAIADKCAESNANFDRVRFLVACGVQS